MLYVHMNTAISLAQHGLTKIAYEQSLIELYQVRTNLIPKQGCMTWNGTAYFSICCLNIHAL